MKTSALCTLALILICPFLPAAEPEGGEKKLVLKFERYGGFAGFHDHISVFDDFSFALVKPDKSVSEGTLSDELQKKLTDQLAHFGEWVKAQSDGPKVADGMETRIEIHGSGEVGEDGDLRDLHRLLHEIVTAAKTAKTTR